MAELKHIDLYTDGACSGNPGVGGYGGILMYRGVEREYSGVDANTTNNRMEITAVIEGLKMLKEPCEVHIYSDSAYLVNCYIQRWYKGWQQFGWYNSKNEPVKNQDLWEELIPCFENLHYSFIKIKGHSKDRWNDRVDKLAQAAAEQALLAGKEI